MICAVLTARQCTTEAVSFYLTTLSYTWLCCILSMQSESRRGMPRKSFLFSWSCMAVASFACAQRAWLSKAKSQEAPDIYSTIAQYRLVMFKAIPMSHHNCVENLTLNVHTCRRDVVRWRHCTCTYLHTFIHNHIVGRPHKMTAVERLQLQCTCMYVGFSQACSNPCMCPCAVKAYYMCMYADYMYVFGVNNCGLCPLLQHGFQALARQGTTCRLFNNTSCLVSLSFILG